MSWWKAKKQNTAKYVERPGKALLKDMPKYGKAARQATAQNLKAIEKALPGSARYRRRVFNQIKNLDKSLNQQYKKLEPLKKQLKNEYKSLEPWEKRLTSEYEYLQPWRERLTDEYEALQPWREMLSIQAEQVGEAMPMIDQQQQIVSEMLTGNIPEATREQIMRTLAERGGSGFSMQAAGKAPFIQSPQAMLAENIRQTAEARIAQGMQYAPIVADQRRGIAGAVAGLSAEARGIAGTTAGLSEAQRGLAGTAAGLSEARRGISATRLGLVEGQKGIAGLQVGILGERSGLMDTARGWMALADGFTYSPFDAAGVAGPSQRYGESKGARVAEDAAVNRANTMSSVSSLIGAVGTAGAIAAAPFTGGATLSMLPATLGMMGGGGAVGGGSVGGGYFGPMTTGGTPFGATGGPAGFIGSFASGQDYSSGLRGTGILGSLQNVYRGTVGQPAQGIALPR